MIHLDQRIFCYLDGITPEERENKRVKTIQGLGLLNSETVPVFEEATQAASRFLEIPISILGLILPQELLIKSAVGLSYLGLMNEMSISRKIARDDSFAVYVIDSQHSLVIEDTYNDSFFSSSKLAQYYGIHSYLGIPLITADNICIGVLEVMDLAPRKFSHKDIEFLNLTACWCLREFENKHLQTSKIIETKTTEINTFNTFNTFESQSLLTNYYPNQITLSETISAKEKKFNPLVKIKIDLLKEIIQDLKSPLTSIIGMSSVLNKEIYGELNKKQKDYIRVITNSGENLRELIEEIIALDVFEENYLTPQRTLIDLETLGQEITNNLNHIATQHKQKLNLTKEPGLKHWQLDRNLIKKSLYYLLISVITTGEPNSEVRIHFSQKSDTLNIGIGNYNPWLGENLGGIDPQSSLITNILSWTLHKTNQSESDELSQPTLHIIPLSYQSLANRWSKNEEKYNHRHNREMLTLLLSCYLTEIHQGNMSLQGSDQLGYRYMLQFPQI
jgi:hypothetical protein